MNTHCAISGCHNGSNATLPNWTDLATVQANAARYKNPDIQMAPCRQRARPDMQPAEVQAITCWVDDGALNN